MRGKKLTEKKKGQLMMVICAVLWSTSGLVMKYIDWSPFLIGGGRAVFSTLVVGVSMIITGNKLKVSKLCVLSAIMSFLNVNFFIAANKLTTAANAIVLQYTAPIFVLVITGLVLHTKLKKVEIGAVGLALIGIVLFFMDQMDTNGMIGNIFAVLSGFFMAIMMVANGTIKDDDERLTGVLLGHGSLALISLPIGLLLTDSSMITLVPILLVVYLGIFQLGIPYALYGRASGIISPIACSLISMIEPMLNPVWVALFYKEIPGFWALVGAVLIIAAVIGYTMIEDRESKVAEDVKE